MISKSALKLCFKFNLLRGFKFVWSIYDLHPATPASAFGAREIERDAVSLRGLKNRLACPDFGRERRRCARSIGLQKRHRRLVGLQLIKHV